MLAALLLVQPLAYQGPAGRSRLLADPARAVQRCAVVASATSPQTESFVQTEMRAAAMALHSRDQAPREGQQPAQKPVQAWEPTIPGYVQFLADSRAVYSALEQAVESREELQGLRRTGLERVAALDADLAWFAAEGHPTPEPTSAATDYAAALQRMRPPAFVCHFYNYYFAHTAGGRMIGKQLSDKLLDGRTLEFYKWDGDVKAMLTATREEIDRMAAEWTQEEKDECLAETGPSFKYSGAILASLKA